MECILPGRVLVAPQEHYVEEFTQDISKEIGLPFSFDYSIEDILLRYDLPVKLDELRKRFGPLPRVGRVPEGHEGTAAERLRKIGHIKAACPDFAVRPHFSGLKVNQSVIDDAIAYVGAQSQATSCGDNCTIGVLDTGVDGSVLTNQGALSWVQYDVDNPLDKGGAPSDAMGHGSLVAYIINCIAPSARIISIKTITDTGSISGVLAGLYLSSVVGPCDLLNLSLSVSCDSTQCPHCSQPILASANAAQLEFLFQRFISGAGDCAIIAAAGNGYSHVAMPASFPNIIAVGDFDFRAQTPSPNSNYHDVPVDRYILAPGARPSQRESFGNLPGHKNAFPMWGTSFATAIVTGVAARYVCGLRGGQCSKAVKPSGVSLFEHLRDNFKNTAKKKWSNYDPQKHGLGAVNFP
ncbi:MAG: hypothetical protein EPO08_04475 [Rhodospirillaceae bacterium]|nr:MAG: hypothetical protein EPO08_04475 [Rhodospirillaceae bacterium]